jgi:hypothetical protein
MLTIRPEQERELARPFIERFERRAAEHLRRYVPDACLSLGDAALAAAINHGIARATHHGLETERDLLRFLTLMFVFGRDFDVDPALPWAAEILRSPGDATDKTERLHVQALRNRALGKGYAGHA